jgi:hypothetical protein
MPGKSPGLVWIHALLRTAVQRGELRCLFFGAKKMRTYQKFLAVIALSGMCFLPAAASENEAAVRKSKRSAKTETAAEQRCEVCEAIKRLEEKVAAQQAEIDALKSALQQGAGAAAPVVDEKAAAAAAAAQQQAAAAEAAAAEARAKAEAATAQNEALRKSLEETTTTAQSADQRAKEFEAPASIHYKNIKITPGGYLAAEGVWRQRALSADTYSDFNKLPFPGDSRYDMTEFRASARASRISVLAEGAVKHTKLSGYVEVDFEGAAPTANENQTGSFNPRLRQAFGQASWNGWTVSAGQSWSLVTLNLLSIKPRHEWIPATIDGNYVLGYTYLRGTNVRVAKILADGHATAAFSVENPAILVGGTVPGNVITGGPGTGQMTNGGGTCTTNVAGTTCTVAASNFTTNLAPDLVAKVAFDPRFAHIEVKAVGRFFRDRVIGVDNNMELGGGVGAGIIVPVLNKKVSLIADAMFGRGIGRYSVGGNQASADIAIFSDGSIHPLQELHGIGGVEVHVTPNLDWYVYGGEDYIGRDFDATSATIGYGNPLKSVGVCVAPDTGFNATSACTANTKSLIQGTTGFWYNIYKGGYGTLRYGSQYSWTYKTTWAGVGGAPKTSDNMVLTSFRYIIP